METFAKDQLASSESDSGIWSTERLLAGLIGLLTLLFVIWRQRSSEYADRIPKDEGVTNEHYPDDFTKCQSADCMRCQQRNKDLTHWKDRLERFSREQTTENQARLCELLACLNGQESHGCRPRLQNPTTLYYQKLKAAPWYEMCDIPSVTYKRDVQRLKDNTKLIQVEFDRIYAEFFTGDQTGWTVNNVPTGSWVIFHFFNQGSKIEENCARCPKTVNILESLEAFMSGVLFGYACFSVLQPGTRITPHCGPCNLRIRLHLGLHIPQSCSLTVAEETRQWQEGECLLFDDSFLHEVKYAPPNAPRTECGSRVILLADLWHPELCDIEREALRHTFAPVSG